MAMAIETRPRSLACTHFRRSPRKHFDRTSTFTWTFPPRFRSDRMKRLIDAVRGLSPDFRQVFVYFLTASILILAVAQGLEPHGEHAGTLWGLRLKFGDSADQILQNAYIEMVRHVWTI